MSNYNVQDILHTFTESFPHHSCFAEALRDYLVGDFLDEKRALGDSDWVSRLAEHLGAGLWVEYPTTDGDIEEEFQVDWDVFEQTWSAFVDDLLNLSE